MHHHTAHDTEHSRSAKRAVTLSVCYICWVLTVTLAKVQVHEFGRGRGNQETRETLDMDTHMDTQGLHST